MDKHKLKAVQGFRRKNRVRRSIHGTAAKPRLSVHRTNFHIYAQLIDDDACVTLAAASSNDKGAPTEYGGNVNGATKVGEAIAVKAKEKGIAIAVFDRGMFRFHGRVKALARAATKAGLVCTGLEDTPKKEKKVAAPGTKKPKKVPAGG